MKTKYFIGKHVTHKHERPHSFRDGKWSYKTELRDVILMAVVGAHAMVRRPHCAPYVAPLKDLIGATRPQPTKEEM